MRTIFASRNWFRVALILVATLGLSTSTSHSHAQKTEPAAPGSVVAELTKEIESVQPFVAGAWTKQWIEQVAQLEKVVPKKIKINDGEIVVDESLYYNGRYGSPLTYEGVRSCREAWICADCKGEGLRLRIR
jgi:hypothetical protein